MFDSPEARRRYKSSQLEVLLWVMVPTASHRWQCGKLPAPGRYISTYYYSVTSGHLCKLLRGGFGRLQESSPRGQHSLLLTTVVRARVLCYDWGFAQPYIASTADKLIIEAYTPLLPPPVPHIARAIPYSGGRLLVMLRRHNYATSLGGAWFMFWPVCAFFLPSSVNASSKEAAVLFLVLVSWESCVCVCGPNFSAHKFSSRSLSIGRSHHECLCLPSVGGRSRG